MEKLTECVNATERVNSLNYLNTISIYMNDKTYLLLSFLCILLGNWYSYTFSDNALGTAERMPDAAEKNKTWPVKAKQAE